MRASRATQFSAVLGNPHAHVSLSRTVEGWGSALTQRGRGPSCRTSGPQASDTDSQAPLAFMCRPLHGGVGLSSLRPGAHLTMSILQMATLRRHSAAQRGRETTPQDLGARRGTGRVLFSCNEATKIMPSHLGCIGGRFPTPGTFTCFISFYL